MLVVMSLFAIGLSFGHIYISIFGELLGIFFALVTGFLSFFLFAWPIFKKLSYLPLLLPKCTNEDCNQRNSWYYSPRTQDGIVYLKCANCGQILEWNYYDAVMKDLDTNGNYKRQYKIKWPQLLSYLTEINKNA